MRYVLLDAGHVIENLRLSLKSECLRHTIHYDFDDLQLNRFLGLDENREACLAGLPVFGEGNPPPAVEAATAHESLSPEIQAASRVSAKEVFYEEIDTICRAGRKISNGMISTQNMRVDIGLKASEWISIPPSDSTKNETGFVEAILKRRSKRNYIPESVSGI